MAERDESRRRKTDTYRPPPPNDGSAAEDLIIEHRRWSERAPDLILLSAAMGATGLFLVALSTPVIDVGPALWGAGLLLFSVLGWSDRRRTAAAVPARRVQRAWVVVVAGVLVVGLVVADVPFRVRWTFSRQEFDAAARRMRSTPSDGWVEVRGGSIAGLPVAEAHRDGRNVWFRYDATSRFAVLDFNNRFFAYLPDGGLGDRAADSLDEGIEVTSLGDGWYYVHDEAD